MLAGSGDDRREGVRRRLLAGVVEAAAAEGYRGVAVADVLAASGCARRSFYTHFSDLESCLHAAHDAATRQAAELATDAWVGGSAGSLTGGLEAVLDALVRFAREEPRLARFWLFEAPVAGGPVVWRQHARFAERLAAFVRPLVTVDGSEPPLLTELLTAAIVAALRERVAEGDSARLAALPGDAMTLVAQYAPAAGGPVAAAA